MLNLFNEYMFEIYTPGTELTIDETVLAFTGNGLPHTTYIARKPKDTGAELKSLCDSE